MVTHHDDDREGSCLRRSDYYRTMFASEFQDATKREVALDECHGPVLLQLVEAMYTHEVTDLRTSKYTYPAILNTPHRF